MGPGQNNADLTSLLQMLGGGGGDAAGLGGLGGFGGIAPVANPEEAFAAQLTQLQVKLQSASLQKGRLGSQ